MNKYQLVNRKNFMLMILTVLSIGTSVFGQEDFTYKIGKYTFYEKDKKVGICMFSDFSEDSIFITPPLYKEIVLFHDGKDCYVFSVTNEHNLKGLLDARGDTLLPLEYTKMEEDYLEGGRTPAIRLFKSKKQGIFTYCMGLIIPAIYDELNEVANMSMVMFAIETTLKRKKGLYDFHGHELLPCIYDNISVQRLENLTLQIYDSLSVQIVGMDDFHKIIYAQKDGKWLIQNIYLGAIEDLVCDEEDYIVPIDTSRFRQYDLIIDDTGYVLKEGGYVQYDDIWDEDSPSDGKLALETVVHDQGMDFFIKNGKIGVKDKHGKVLVKPIYTNVHYFDEHYIYVLDKGENYLMHLPE